MTEKFKAIRTKKSKQWLSFLPEYGTWRRDNAPSCHKHLFTVDLENAEECLDYTKCEIVTVELSIIGDDEESPTPK